METAGERTRERETGNREVHRINLGNKKWGRSRRRRRRRRRNRRRMCAT